MIIKIGAHRTSANVVVVHANAELAEFMGTFSPARWQTAAKVYWLEATHLDAFTRHAERSGHTVVDDRAKGPVAEKFTGPLPECSACGQPASRSAALALQRCPACGAVSRPTVVESPERSGWTPKVDCPACGGRQRAGWAFCGRCGATMPPAEPSGPRPPDVPRPKLEEPALFADEVAEVAAGLERDHMQRAAGDR